MKKAKYFMAAGLMALSVLTGMQFTKDKVSAAETVKCELTNVEGHRGETISVIIKVNSNPGTIMSETKFTYDSDVVEVTKVIEHDMFRTEEIGSKHSDYSEPNLAIDPIRLINGFWDFAGNSSNTGNLYTIELKIKDNADFGNSEISFAGNFLDYELNEFPVVCDKASITVVCGHEDVEEVVEKAPTCTEKGINNKICKICNEKVGTVDVPATGHSFGEWTQVNAATCTEAGMDRRSCTVCGEEETRDVAALGHNVETWTVTKEPTYAEEGMKEGECTRCHEVLTQVMHKLSETEIVEADDMFKAYTINISAKVFDKNDNELTDNKLILKANEIKDSASAKESISKLIENDEEVKSISVYEIKLLTNTEKIEVGSLDRPLNVILKVPADYISEGRVYVLGDDGEWKIADIQMEEVADGTIYFDMTKTQTYAFANIGVVENNNPDTPNNNDDNKKPEDNNTNNPNNSNNSNNKPEESKENVGNNTGSTKADKTPVKTGDSYEVLLFMGIMAAAGIVAVIGKKKIHE